MLSKKTKYALHALTYLAKKGSDNPTLIVEISEQAHIPRKFLESILLDLKKQGILASKMGKGGGYFFASRTKGNYHFNHHSFVQRAHCLASVCESQLLPAV